ncbi:MAG: hypothetical protein QNJ04_17230, partial [Desulfobacterales bacterium]|nr:hypothetical protein [Desulfobacterales bacterium]
IFCFIFFPIVVWFPGSVILHARIFFYCYAHPDTWIFHAGTAPFPQGAYLFQEAHGDCTLYVITQQQVEVSNEAAQDHDCRWVG